MNYNTLKDTKKEFFVVTPILPSMFRGKSKLKT